MNDTKLWQRNYWEHIIRNENELNHIRNYIRHNPQKWEMDQLYGGFVTTQAFILIIAFHKSIR